MYVKELFRVFNQIENTSSRLEIISLLADLFIKLDNDEIDKVIYLMQGRISPIYIKKEFGLGEKLIIKGVIKGFQIDRKLFYFEFKKYGDIGLTTEFFRSKINTIESDDLSVKLLFERLSILTEHEGKGSQDLKLNNFVDLLRIVDPLSCRYIVRIPTGNLRLGFSDMTILDALSVMLTGDKSKRLDIERAYNVRPDLGFIAKELKKVGIESLAIIQPEISIPIRMMLAERVGNSKELIKNSGSCFCEPKYDGFRLQAHIDKINNKVFLFSRGLDDVTNMYPDICNFLLKSCKLEKCIVEGEAVGFDVETQKMLPFQQTVQRKRKYDIDVKAQEIPLRFYIFDILYLSDKSVLDTPFEERRKLLEKYISNNQKNIILTKLTLCKTWQDIEKEFQDSVRQGLEGIMAKKINSIYQAGARGWSWIKYKKSYEEKTADTIDCVIMGYDLGKGKRASFGIGAFLVGVLDKEKEKYVTVAKIGTGLTDEEWKELKRQTKLLTIKDVPKDYLVKKEMEVDVWIKPSIIVEIRVDEITVSEMHSAGYAFRFPRLERFRTDKGQYDITTLSEVERLYNISRS